MPKPLTFLFCAGLMAAFSLSAESYKVEIINNPPPGLPAAYAPLIGPQGYRVAGPNGVWVEIWFRQTLPKAAKPADDSIVFPIVQGTLLGVLSFPGRGYDRRGQTIQPGLYTMRYSVYPVDGSHQGVAPQRDFALLTPIAADPDAAALPNYEALVALSVKASGTSHPAVYSLEPPAAGAAFPSVTPEGDSDQVLNVKVGDMAIGIIVVGKV
jgi:hypothetical protein